MEATLYTKLHTVAFLYKPVRSRLSSLPYKNPSALSENQAAAAPVPVHKHHQRIFQSFHNLHTAVLRSDPGADVHYHKN